MNRLKEFDKLQTHLVWLGLTPVSAIAVALQAVYGWEGELHEKEKAYGGTEPETE
jgi:hypothetical protein